MDVIVALWVGLESVNTASQFFVQLSVIETQHAGQCVGGVTTSVSIGAAAWRGITPPI